MGLSRQEYWSRQPFPSPGGLPNPEMEPGSPALQADSLPSEPSGKRIKLSMGSCWWWGGGTWGHTSLIGRVPSEGTILPQSQTCLRLPGRTGSPGWSKSLVQPLPGQPKDRTSRPMGGKVEPLVCFEEGGVGSGPFWKCTGKEKWLFSLWER